MNHSHTCLGACGSADHWNRRTLLKAAGLSGLSWLTPLADALSIQSEKSGKRPRSVILLWMKGGASQLDTFDPHPGSSIAYGAKAIDTAMPGIKLGESLVRTAELLPEMTLVRSVTGAEGDHERAVYLAKTGYRINPSVVHPSIGAIICHELTDNGLDIPTHISILPAQWPSRGGHLGAKYDAFQVGDPTQPIPDIKSNVGDPRTDRRKSDLDVIESAFARGRATDIDAKQTLHRDQMQQARRMMSSEQLAAFDVKQATEAERATYGDTPFGRGCLAAIRLVEAGARCIEVTLGGWDTHANNQEQQNQNAAILDTAFSALIRDLIQRDLFDDTIVLCGTEFGRTPKLNAVEGRDHWPHGFSVMLAGGGIRRGYVHGATDPTGEKKEPDSPIKVADLHATIQSALGIDPEYEMMTSANRPLAFSEGRVIEEFLRSA
ncbi:MAG: DUF1501 domain-containing protein [Verrucomicrobiae bacterium]|nr:DUF1501 domain-containing protein [Verrucomicrobiae bacterium]